MFVAREGHHDIVRLILVASGNANTRENIKQTAIHGAARSGQADVMRKLILHNANIGSVVKYGSTPSDLCLKTMRSGEVADFLVDIYSEQEGRRFALHELLRSAKYTFDEAELLRCPGRSEK